LSRIIAKWNAAAQSETRPATLATLARASKNGKLGNIMSSSAAPDEEAISSPCVSVCTLDAARTYCIGCLRTVKEIGAWRTMTLAEKRVVIAACNARAEAQAPLGKDGKPLGR